MITYENYLKGKQPDINDKSDKALYERGKFLVEVIDKQALISSDELSNSIEVSMNKGFDKTIIPYSPSAGKTTAVRQLISNSGRSITGTYSSKLIDDLKSIKYDVESQTMYEGKACPSMMVFTSETNPELEDVIKSQWVLCTHARLVIEPSTVLTSSVTGRSLISAFKLPRNYFIIDEYPSNVYNKVSIKNVRPVAMLDKNIIDENEKMIEKSTNDLMRTTGMNYEVARRMVKMQVRSNSIHESTSGNRRPTEAESELPLLNDFDAPGCKNGISKLKNMSPSDPNFEFKNDRLSFYMGHYSDDYYDTKREDSNVVWDNDNSSLYYSISDLSKEVPITVLDGTGDLTLGKLPNWYVPESRSEVTTRYLNVNRMTMVKSFSKRDHPKDKIVKEYVGILKQVSDEHPDEKILAYTWKFSKDDSLQDTNGIDLKNDILSGLEDLGITNVEILTYMSGEEKGTSKYANCSVAAILGEFYIPNYVVHDINRSLYKSNNDKTDYITSDDYTLSLLIQFIYRTRARKRGIPDNSISIYMDHRYTKFVDDMFDKCSIKGISKNDIKGLSSSEVINNCSRKLKEFKQGGYLIYDESTGYYIGTTKSVSDMTSSSPRRNRLLTRINELNMIPPKVVDKVSNGEVRSHCSVYIFSDDRELSDVDFDKNYLSSIIRRLPEKYL